MQKAKVSFNIAYDWNALSNAELRQFTTLKSLHKHLKRITVFSTAAVRVSLGMETDTTSPDSSMSLESLQVRDGEGGHSFMHSQLHPDYLWW